MLNNFGLHGISQIASGPWMGNMCKTCASASANSGSNYFNYKRTFSVVLLALVDADYRFISVDIGSFGKNSDGGIFANSQLGKALSNGTLDVPGSKQ